METHRDNQGFTLVELMITVAISGMIMAAVYSAYLAQQRTSTAQRQVVEMQQNIRAALTVMMQEVRMAGYDPLKAGVAGVVAAGVGRMRFTQDITNDAGDEGVSDGDVLDADENVTYGFAAAIDADNNGVADAGAANFGRATGAGVGVFQPIAENIEAIEFRYLDEDGAVTAALNDIRSVQISILARAGRPDPEFTNTVTYTPASGGAWDLNGAAAGTAPNDNFRRRLMITTVQCRNMGL